MRRLPPRTILQGSLKRLLKTSSESQHDSFWPNSFDSCFDLFASVIIFNFVHFFLFFVNICGKLGTDH